MRLTRVFTPVFDSLSSLLYPQACALCGATVERRADGVVCHACWSTTRTFTLSDTLCWKCGRLTIKPVAVPEPLEIRCRACDQESFTAVRACGVYEGALRASVLALKHEPLLCQRIVDMLCAVQQREPLSRTTVVVPVPLHETREHSRGFNQAAVIARQVSQANGIPLHESKLIRVSHPEQHRAGLDARGRRDTVANAFQVSHPRFVDGESVLLVDDVFTTGATVNSCSAELIAAGAKEVFVLTIARAGS